MSVSSGVFKIIHSFGYSKEDTAEQKKSVIYKELCELKKRGYDGVVTNVEFEIDYLEDDTEWELMKYKAEACKQLGLRLWAYDEKGYPSGAAGTATLEADPDNEARAVAMVDRVLQSGEAFECELPHGHELPLGAFGYYFEGDKLTDADLEAEPLRIEWKDSKYTFKNDTDKSLLCACFFKKRMYEGAHCNHNAYAARRYVDIGCKAVGDEFIRNTYKKYIDNVPEGIEAFFTDEPSYMGTYLNIGTYPSRTIHQYDVTIPLLPMVSWSRELAERFEKENGYKIEDRLPFLFFGNSDKSCRIRRDFYNTLSLLAEEAYFGNIGDYCENRSQRFSGHILLEDTMLDHVKFEGNFFKLLRHMHVTGMDMLHSKPENVWNLAFVPNLIHSISSVYSDGHVMDEVSDFYQRGQVGDREIFASVMLQYILGADIFTSYYGDRLTDYKVNGISLLEAIRGAIAAMGERVAPKVVLHYPIETVMGLRKPDVFEYFDDECAAAIEKCEQSTYECMYALMSEQVPFVFSDTETFKETLRFDPEFVILPIETVDEGLVEALKQMKEHGCRIIAVTDGGRYFDTSAISPFVQMVCSVREAMEIIRGGAFIKTSGDTEGVAALWTDDGVMLCNSEEIEKSMKIKLAAQSVVDCRTDSPIEFKVQNGQTEFVLKKYQVLIIK